MGILQASYYQRVNEKVDLGTELQLVAVQGRRQAVCNVGAKWEFSKSTFRGQIDTTGKVSAVMEEKLVPGISFFICGELDHAKTESRFGLGLTMEG
jgi:mitochondrial import receptor subunit TOM40